jgi:hypothetical protein
MVKEGEDALRQASRTETIQVAAKRLYDILAKIEICVFI